jgi:hypothetical protein
MKAEEKLPNLRTSWLFSAKAPGPDYLFNEPGRNVYIEEGRKNYSRSETETSEENFPSEARRVGFETGRVAGGPG